jgi:hypothetical protein
MLIAEIGRTLLSMGDSVRVTVAASWFA